MSWSGNWKNARPPAKNPYFVLAKITVSLVGIYIGKSIFVSIFGIKSTLHIKSLDT
jgi:hypothetical protein